MKSRLLVFLCLIFFVNSSAQTWQQLNDSLIYYYHRNDFKRGIEYAEKALELARKNATQNNDIAASLNNLGELYRQGGHYEKAIPLFEEFIKIKKSISGEKDPAYSALVNKVAVLYYELKQYEKAEELYTTATELRKQNLGENHPDYLTSLSNLALVYQTTRQYQKAELLYIEIKDKQVQLGVEHFGYALATKELGKLYYLMGQYEKAEPLYIESRELYKKNDREESPEFADNLNALALLYDEIGQYGKAISLFEQALEIYEKGVGENNGDYATVLNNLARVCSHINELNKAEALYRKSLEITGKLFGESHYGYANALNNLAELFSTKGQFSEAEVLHRKAKAIRKELFGENSIEYANSLNNLALVYHNTQLYSKAEPLYVQAKNITKKVLGEAHPLYFNLLNNLAFLYTDRGMHNQAETLMIAATNQRIETLRNIFAVLSEEEKENYLNNTLSLISNNNSFLFTLKDQTPALVLNNVNLLLYVKSLILSSTQQLHSTVRTSNDSSIIATYKRWQKQKEVLARQYALPVDYRLNNLDSIQVIAESLEKELTQKSSTLRNHKPPVSVTSIQKALAKDEAAIEFVRFNLYNRRLTDSILYAAYIIRKDSSPKWVLICEEKQLQQLFTSAGKTTTASISAFYRGAVEENDNVSVSKGDSLYDLVWRPLEPYLKGIKKVSYSPAGKLYTVAFNALPVGGEKLLMDKYSLH